MEIRVFDNYNEMSKAAAEILCKQLAVNPCSNIGITAGSTPKRMYEYVVEKYNRGEVSFRDCTLFSLEEMCHPGLTKNHPASICQDLGNQLLNLVDLKEGHFILPDCETNNPEEECRKYTGIIDSLPDGRLDMQIIGVGSDGHIGMNRPAKELVGDCHVVDFEEVKEWTESIESKFGLPITKSMAMGVRNILQAKTLVMIANGKSKAKAIHDMIHGDITTYCPASLLQLHPNAIILLDKEAALYL